MSRADRRARTGAAILASALAAGPLPSSGCSPVYSSAASAEAPPPSVVRVEPEPRPRPEATGRSAALARVLGRLIWPLAMDRSSALSSPYGIREHPVNGGERFHRGLDLRADEGTPVYSVADGRVVRSGPAGAYGNAVVIDHGAGLRSLYGHNRENLVAEGELARRGQVIALVGHTGNATGDHLHFELRWSGGTVDPWAVLPTLSAGAHGR